jgi:hypothetical protein
MSRRVITVLLVVLCAGTPAGLAAQTGDAFTAPTRQDLGVRTRGALATQTRDEVAARVDSLLVEHANHMRLLLERDSIRSARVPALPTDTTLVGPFLYVNREVASAAAVAALHNAWQVREAMVGTAAEILDGTVVSRDLAPASKHYRYSPQAVGGRPDYLEAAERTVTRVLNDALPRDVQNWLAGTVLTLERGALVWAYRDLATSGVPAVRRCFDRDIPSCVTALTGEGGQSMTPRTRASVLQHALELGGEGSYARLLEDAPDVTTRLANAANVPIQDVLTSWRDAVQDARPRVHAGVARAGFWTLVWLLGLALFAMRSTRWRLG